MKIGVSCIIYPKSDNEVPWGFELVAVTFLFANRMHVSIHWILVQALAYIPVPNYDMPGEALYCDHFDQWFIAKKALTS